MSQMVRGDIQLLREYQKPPNSITTLLDKIETEQRISFSIPATIMNVTLAAEDFLGAVTAKPTTQQFHPQSTRLV